MQISTTLFYDMASKRMTTLTGRANVLQTQIATGKRVQSASEDAALAQQVAEFDRKDSDSAVYQTNLALAGSLLGQADGVLTNMNGQLQRAKELALQSANGTQTPESRKLIAVEMSSIVDSLVGLANTRNLRGQPLFGTEGGTKAVTDNGDGTFAFAPTKVSDVPIGDGQMVKATESADRIFNFGGSTDTLTMLSALAKTLGDGDAPSAGALDDLTKAADQVTFVQASVGARGARIELQQSQLTTASVDRAALRSSVEDVDITSSIAELQKIMTVLSATQASFSKLSSLSLFNYLR
ncbi:MAG: flagellar hook-associated protein 3 [Pseudomonadota bacterium]|nr:flagellar hook-associated protein 3 [Pseudomonadota bacterium]